MINGGWSFVPHFKYIIPKAEKVFGALSNILPNLKGPEEKVKILYSNVIHSVLLYGAPIWAGEVTKNAHIKRDIYRLQKKICLRICCGYRTVSFVAALLLARGIPLDLMAFALQQMYVQVKNLDRVGAGMEHTSKVRLCIQAKREARDRWREKLTTAIMDRRGTSGTRTSLAVLPHFADWYSRREGHTTCHCTQILLEHGCFKAYLFKIRRADSPNCEHCSEEQDTAQHTLEFCPAWEQERAELRGELECDEDLDLTEVVRRILEDIRKWRAFNKFCSNVPQDDRTPRTARLPHGSSDDSR
nr:PREDICTED: uncharacterized protein LOC105677372 [Linepithema humile]